MIKPTIGRVVWFYPEDGMLQPYAALIAYVWSDVMVNLAFFDTDGIAHNATSVQLYQGEDFKPSCFYCEWMPYQIGQAKKNEDKNIGYITPEMPGCRGK